MYERGDIYDFAQTCEEKRKTGLIYTVLPCEVEAFTGMNSAPCATDEAQGGGSVRCLIYTRGEDEDRRDGWDTVVIVSLGLRILRNE